MIIYLNNIPHPRHFSGNKYASTGAYISGSDDIDILVIDESDWKECRLPGTTGHYIPVKFFHSRRLQNPNLSPYTCVNLLPSWDPSSEKIRYYKNGYTDYDPKYEREVSVDVHVNIDPRIELIYFSAFDKYFANGNVQYFNTYFDNPNDALAYMGIKGKIDPISTNSAPTNLLISSSKFDENISNGSVISTISSSDPDENDSHSYKLISGHGDSDNSAFIVDKDRLKIVESPDYESKSSYSIRLRSTDTAGLYFDKTFTLSVNDIDEDPGDPKPPSTPKSPTDIKLSTTDFNENIADGSVISTISSSDPDENDSHSYKLISGHGDSDNSAFIVDKDRLKIVESPDYESKSSYSIRLRSTDTAGLYFDKKFTLSVNDIDESSTNLKLNSSNFTNNLLILSFNSDIAKELSARGRYHVSDGEKKIRLASVRHVSNEILLKLEKNLQSLDHVYLGYKDSPGDQKKGVIQSIDGVDFPSLDNLKIANSKAPVLLKVPNGSFSAKNISLVFDQELGSRNVDPRLFSVTSAGGQKLKIARSQVDLTSKIVSLVLRSDASRYDSLFIDYINKSSNKQKRIESSTGNPLSSFSGLKVDNSQAPKLLTVPKASFSGKSIVLVFDKALGNKSVDPRLFNVTTSGGDKLKIAKAQVDSTAKTVSLVLRTDASRYDSLLVDYTDEASNKLKRIESLTGNPLPSFSQLKTTNNIAPLDISLQSAVFSDNSISLRFDRALGSRKVDPKLFQVYTPGGEALKVKGISANGSKISISLSPDSSASRFSSVSLSYMAKNSSIANGVKSITGNPLDSFEGFNVSNKEKPVILSLDQKQSGFSNNYIVLQIDGQMKTDSLKAPLFKVSLGRSFVRVNSASINQKTNSIILALNEDVSTLDSLYVSYQAPKKDRLTGVIQSVTGNDLEVLDKIKINNSVVDNKRPRLTSAELRKRSADVILEFNEDLNPGRLDRDLFNVKYFGDPEPISGVSFIGKRKVLIDLRFENLPDVPKKYAPVLDYSPGGLNESKGVIEDLRGNDLAEISNYRISI